MWLKVKNASYSQGEGRGRALQPATVTRVGGSYPPTCELGETGETFICIHGEPTWGYLYRQFIPALAGHGRSPEEFQSRTNREPPPTAGMALMSFS